MNRKRKPKNANLAGLEVVDHKQAYDGKRLKKRFMELFQETTLLFLKMGLIEKPRKTSQSM